MSSDSPLFISAVETLVHAAELFVQNDPRRYKFVVLHLANAIELILKDRVLDEGISIFQEKDRNLTIGVWNAIEILKSQSVQILEQPFIELLFNERNTIQHRYGSPESLTVLYYLKATVGFFRRFLGAEYSTDLTSQLKLYTSSSRALELLTHIHEDTVYLLKLAESLPTANTGQTAITQARSAIDREADKIVEPFASQLGPYEFFWSPAILKELEQQGLVSEGTSEHYEQLMSPDLDSIEWHELMGFVVKLLSELRVIQQTKSYTPQLDEITVSL